MLCIRKFQLRFSKMCTKLKLSNYKIVSKDSFLLELMAVLILLNKLIQHSKLKVFFIIHMRAIILRIWSKIYRMTKTNKVVLRLTITLSKEFIRRCVHNQSLKIINKLNRSI